MQRKERTRKNSRVKFYLATEIRSRYRISFALPKFVRATEFRSRYRNSFALPIFVRAIEIRSRRKNDFLYIFLFFI